MFYRGKILVTLKPEVKDSKAQVLKQTVLRKEFAQIKDCSVGKYFSIEIYDESKESAKKAFEKIAEEVLSNPVIEQYEILSFEQVNMESEERNHERVESRNCCLSCH